MFVSLRFFYHVTLILIGLILFVNSAKKAKKSSFDKDDYKLFIIAGTQKSGTTVLSGLLAEHPLIAFSKKKELHYYDKPANYEKGLKHYLKSFTPNSNTVYIGEATPYYIASRHACQKIADDFPDAKLIIMLREPIERAYSEYNMKVRRVEKQNQFYSMLNEDISRYRQCFSENDVEALKTTTCFPDKISQHTNYKKLLLAMRKAVENNHTWPFIIDRCFPEQVDMPKVLKIPYQPCQMLPTHVQSSCYFDSNSLSQGFFWLYNRSIDENDQIRKRLFPQREYFNLSIYRSYFEEPVYSFDAKACFRDHTTGNEKLKPLQEALVEEAAEFDECAQLDKTVSDLPIVMDEVVEEELKLKTLSAEKEEPVNPSLDWALERLDEVNEAVDRCLKIRAGISTQYIYRSMYAIQLYQCFMSFDPEQFLIIPSGDMRNQPASVLRTVLQFLNLPIDRKWIQNVTQNAEEVVSERFQDFAKTTSWQLKSDYPPLDSSIRETLEKFFHFYNDLLFRLIEEDISPFW